MKLYQMFVIPVPIKEIGGYNIKSMMVHYIPFFQFEIVKMEIKNQLLTIAVKYV